MINISACTFWQVKRKGINLLHVLFAVALFVSVMNMFLYNTAYMCEKFFTVDDVISDFYSIQLNKSYLAYDINE